MTFDWETTSGFSPCLGWQIHSQLPVHVACGQISLVVWELLCLASGSKFQESAQKGFHEVATTCRNHVAFPSHTHASNASFYLGVLF